MEEEQKDANPVDSSATEDANTEESSTLETTEVQDAEATVEKAPEKEPPFHEHPDWKAFQERERQRVEAAEQRAAELEQRYHDVVTRLQQPGTQPTKQEMDLIQKYGANDPATREFLRDIKADRQQDMEKYAEKVAAPLFRENEALRRNMAMVQEKLFRAENKDVTPNSPEEREIAGLVQMGVPLDKATKAIMYDKRIAEAQGRGAVKQKVQTTKKVAANLEAKSVPEVSGLPQNRSMNFKEDLREQMRRAGL